MDRQYIRDHEVIERYLQGALTADEEQAFEEAYLGDAELLEELQTAERLRDGVKQLDAAGRLGRSRSPQRWRAILASPRYAAAASVLLAVSLGFSTVLYRENRSLSEGAFPTTAAITRFVPIDSVRGDNAVTIREPEDDEWTALLVDAGPTAYDTYRAALARRSGEQSETIWTRADLTPELGGTIVIGVPGRFLRPGSYEATVDGRMNDWPAERFEAVARMGLTVTARD